MFHFLIWKHAISGSSIVKKIRKRAEEAAKETVIRKVEEKAAEKTERAMDTILNADKKIKRRKKSRRIDENQEDDSSGEVAYEEETSEVFEFYSKFDFIPGDKILLFDDFSIDNIGDFPLRWNTNGSGVSKY